MYRKKSEIIEQIQSYHKQVAQLYGNICKSIEDENIKSLIMIFMTTKKRGKNILSDTEKLPRQ